MAKVVTKIALNMHGSASLTFADFLDAKKSQFSNDKIVMTQDNGERDAFYGSFRADAIRKTINGTATSWAHAKNGHLQWQIDKLDASAAMVFAAAKTKTTKDDQAAIEKIFSKADTIIGSKFADQLLGYEGDDTITAGGGRDTVDGGTGHDRISFDYTNSSVVLTLDNAHPAYAYVGGTKGDRIANIEDIGGGGGNDSFTGTALANRLIGGGGNDTLAGSGGHDTLRGGGGNDSLVGGSGNDDLAGEANSDNLRGGGGNDKLDGGTQSDYLSGGDGNDTLLGGAGGGNDVLDGGAGNDTIDGSAGKDTLTGGTGKDLLTGGADADIFRFSAIGESLKKAAGRDFIFDFKHNTDKIDLSAIDAMATLADDQAFVRDAKGTASSVVAEGHIGYFWLDRAGKENDRTFVRINIDADASIEMVIELKGLIHLTPGDFIL